MRCGVGVEKEACFNPKCAPANLSGATMIGALYVEANVCLKSGSCDKIAET